MKQKYRYNKWDIINLTVFYSILLCFFVATILGAVQAAKGEISVVKLLYRIGLTMILFLPYMIKSIFKISFSRVVCFVYYTFVFLSGFMGTVLEFYKKYAWWDIAIHFLMGAILSVLSIYILIGSVYKKDGGKKNIWFTFLFMIIFAVGVGALWEIFEFVLDLIFNSGYQRYITYDGQLLVGQRALMDTMIDLIMDFAGAVFGVVFVTVAKKVDKNFIASFRIKRMKPLEEEIESIEE